MDWSTFILISLPQENVKHSISFSWFNDTYWLEMTAQGNLLSVANTEFGQVTSLTSPGYQIVTRFFSQVTKLVTRS